MACQFYRACRGISIYSFQSNHTFVSSCVERILNSKWKSIKSRETEKEKLPIVRYRLCTKICFSHARALASVIRSTCKAHSNLVASTSSVHCRRLVVSAGCYTSGWISIRVRESLYKIVTTPLLSIARGWQRNRPFRSATVWQRERANTRHTVKINARRLSGVHFCALRSTRS